MASGIRWTEERVTQFYADMERRRKESPALPPEIERRGKYNNAKVVIDNVKFDSKKEAKRWGELLALEDSGKICDLRRQVPFELAPAVHLAGEKRKKPALRYFADAVYVLDGVLVVEDTKSPPTRKTQIYRAKRHLMATVHGIHIKEV